MSSVGTRRWTRFVRGLTRCVLLADIGPFASRSYPLVERVRCTRVCYRSRSCLRRHQFGWRSTRLPCYPIRMQVVARSLSLLLLAVAMMLPTVARTSARAEALIAVSVAFEQFAVPHHAGKTLMRCHRCFGAACGESAVSCGAYCGAASALTPVVIVLMSVTKPAAGPFAFKAVRDHGNPPDPHPPRSLAIS